MIKKWLSTFFVILICYLLQTTLFFYIRLAGVVPNLLIIVVVSTAYLRGQRDGLFTGLICGLLSDMIFGSVIGLHGLLYMLVGYISGYGKILYWRNNFSVPLILIGLGDVIYNFLFYIFEFLLRGKMNLLSYLIDIIIPEMVYTMLVGVLLYKIIWCVDRLVLPKDSEEDI